AFSYPGDRNAPPIGEFDCVDNLVSVRQAFSGCCSRNCLTARPAGPNRQVFGLSNNVCHRASPEMDSHREPKRKAAPEMGRRILFGEILLRDSIRVTSGVVPRRPTVRLHAGW